MSALVGIVTYGGTEFTRLAVQSIRDTTREEVDIFIVVGMPKDTETLTWLEENPDINFICHDKNYGFPYGLNDIFDYAWVKNNYDYLILAGNDVVAYPFCIDSLIELAKTSAYECISAFQYDVNELVEDFPETEKNFTGEFRTAKNLKDHSWDAFKGYSSFLSIEDMNLRDIQNLCLYKKSVFDRVGYTDVSFFPAYFVDNDYAMRMAAAKVKSCTLENARFFHFWSRTIHQGANNNPKRHVYFKRNEGYYINKYGGAVGKETKSPPVKIDSRENEKETIEFWR
jgi:GT2 family glycosyltransferase